MTLESARVGLKGWEFAKSLIQDSRSGLRMLNPSIDLGSVCDLACPYCFTASPDGNDGRQRSSELTATEVMAVLDDFAGAQARTVNIVGAGEPLLFPALHAVVKQLHRNGITVVLFTNGTRLAANPDLARFLFNHGVSIVLKFNSRRPQLQDAVVGRRGYTEQRDNALQLLIGVGFNASTPTRLGVDTLAFVGNLRELPEIHRWCREENIYPLTSDFIPTGRTVSGEIQRASDTSYREPELETIAARALTALTYQERVELVRTLAGIDRELGIEQEAIRAYYGGGACTQLLGVYVNAEGIIWPCVAQRRLVGPPKEPLGSIRAGDKPSEIWRRSPYLEWLRKNYTGACPYKAPISILLSSETLQHVRVDDGQSQS